ncbi:uncharacterized protein BX664DRAFT_329922 [Halteromyces radiatus]|uniref:uncharacterized protein n=1 Tax=Halteromyces radiatus TaxID=101107 RepID=UPI00222101EF|nr:uncharacterized protein BX664DRAFT_329922 [Halteromyces radiatus]KAI8093530.1 hypothetical protein BX664DRAFT_329922 [Halteromyces radiatus]
MYQPQQLPPSSSQQPSYQHNSFVSSALVPNFDFGNILCKQRKQQNGFDNNLFREYPLLIPALMSIVIGHTMSMSTEDLLSHTRLLSTPTPSSMARPSANPFGGDLYFGNKMTPGLRRPFQDGSTLSKKQVHAIWENLLDNMVMVRSKQQVLSTTKEEDVEASVVQEMVRTSMKWDQEHRIKNEDNNDDDDYYDDDDDDEPWYDMPVTGFKAICPLYWMQRQFCRFVITYVVVKYPHLENSCKTYLPICEQYRRRLVTA